MKQINKKADLMPETLKIIVAVVGILILLGLAFAIYSGFSNKTEKRQAQATLDQIIFSVNSAAVKGGVANKLVILSPKRWSIKSIARESMESVMCSGEGCICICPANSVKSNEECFTKGVCKSVTSQINIKDSCGVSFVENCLDFESLPANLFIEKKGDIVELKTGEDVEGEKEAVNLLDYKKDFSSKSLQELIVSLGEDIDKDRASGISGESEYRSGLRKELDETVKKYIAELQPEKKYKIKDSFRWTFVVNHNGVIYSLNNDRVTEKFELNKILASTNYEFGTNNGYTALLTYQDGKWLEPGSLSSGTLPI